MILYCYKHCQLLQPTRTTYRTVLLYNIKENDTKNAQFNNAKRYLFGFKIEA